MTEAQAALGIQPGEGLGLGTVLPAATGLAPEINPGPVEGGGDRYPLLANDIGLLLGPLSGMEPLPASILNPPLENMGLPLPNSTNPAPGVAIADMGPEVWPNDTEDGADAQNPDGSHSSNL